jgi:uncharacterized protein YbcI
MNKSIETTDGKPSTSVAQQIATATSAFHLQSTGHAPAAVTAVLSEDTLVNTLYDALTPAEKLLVKSADGAATVQEFHRQLFATSSEWLREEIRRITGRQVREATAEVDRTTGAIVHAFTTGTVVQVFLLAGSVPADTWSGVGSAIHHGSEAVDGQKSLGRIEHDGKPRSL